MTALHDRAAKMAASAEPYMAADAALEAACNVAQILVLRRGLCPEARSAAYSMLLYRSVVLGVAISDAWAAAKAMADSWAATGKEAESGGVG